METQEFQGHTPGPWYRMHSNDTIRSEPMGDDAEAYLFDIVGATTADAELAAAAPDLLIEVKRLQKKLEESKEDFELFRDSVVKPVLKHVYSDEEITHARSEIEHLNKMFCVGCGACGTETEYAECTC